MGIKNKILAIVFSLALVAMMVPAGASAALTDAQKQAIINMLISFGADAAAIANVQISLNGGTPVITPATGTGACPGACAGVSFTRNLIVGSTGSDVKCLQSILNRSAATQVALTGAGAPGYETTYFGPRTLAAVRIYQVQQGWTPVNQAGPLTRARLSQLSGCVINITCTPSWQVGAWSACTNTQQTRIVTDSNHCGVTTNKPATTQSCSASCTPNWSCGSWTTCYNNQQTRTCTDSNYCGVTTNKPATTQSCSASCTPQWQCSDWSICTSSQQNRTCTDSKNCGVATNKPATAQSCVERGDVRIQANNSDGPVTTFLTLGNGASVNQTSGGIILTQSINLTWTGVNVSSCVASDSLTSATTIFSGHQLSSGSQTVTLTGNIPGTSPTDKVSDTFKITCISTINGSTVSDSVTVNLYYTIVGSCTPNWQYIWGACTNSQQAQIWTDLNGCGSSIRPTVETRTCTPLCTESNWTSSLSACLVSGTQTKTWTQIGTCAGGITHPATETVSCVYQPITCTSFAYTSWSPAVCPPTGIQTRTITSSSPSGCTGGTPILSQTCTPQPSIDIQANNSDGPVNIFLTLGNGATVNPLGGITLTQGINLQWTGFDVQSCLASDLLTPTIFSGYKPSPGSQTVTLAGNIPGTSTADKVSDTFKITCVTSAGSTINNSVTVNLYYTVPESCTPSWTCGVWSACVNSQHTRTCIDSNGCGSLIGRPAVSESCTLILTTINLTPASASLYVGHTQQLTATKLDQEGNPISANLTWSSNNPSKATVSSNGLVTAVAVGTATITASSGSVMSNGVQITVQPAPILSTINLTPASVSLYIGQYQQLTATKLDQYGNPISANLTWSSSNPSVVIVGSTSGLTAARAAGTAFITASSGSVVSNSVQITVQPVPITSITVTPASANLVVSGSPHTQQLTAIDQDSNNITSTVNWVSSNPSKATVSSSGLVTAVAAGTATITASSGSVVSNSVQITVQVHL